MMRPARCEGNSKLVLVQFYLAPVQLIQRYRER
jgi:hypothetical protein